MIRRRAVLFDLYGTLADVKVDERTKSFWDRLVSYPFFHDSNLTGKELRDLYLSIVDDERKNGGQEGSILSAVFGQLLVEAGVKADKSAVHDLAHAFRRESIILLQEKPYARSVLTAVKSAGCAVGLISNTEALLTDYDLDQLDFKPLFDLICLSSQTGLTKPDPRIFTGALKKMGVKSAEAVFVGDDFDADVRGATDSGLDVVFLSNAKKPLKDASIEKHALVIQCKSTVPSITKALRTLGLEMPKVAAVTDARKRSSGKSPSNGQRSRP